MVVIKLKQNTAANSGENIHVLFEITLFDIKQFCAVKWYTMTSVDQRMHTKETGFRKSL